MNDQTQLFLLRDTPQAKIIYEQEPGLCAAMYEDALLSDVNSSHIDSFTDTRTKCFAVFDGLYPSFLLRSGRSPIGVAEITVSYPRGPCHSRKASTTCAAHRYRNTAFGSIKALVLPEGFQ